MKPSPPFDRWPVHVRDPSYGFTWFVEPNIMVDHLTVAEGTEEMVAAMHRTLDKLLASRGDSIERSGGLRVVADWRSVRTYTSGARKAFMHEITRRRPLASAAVVVEGANSLLRMAVKAADMALAMTGGPRIELHDDVVALLRREGLSAESVRVGAF
jgi:hypothetical protein